MIERKLILSHVREGDFTHPGEIEAIDIALSRLPRRESDSILDVGCGLGGTLQYMQGQGWNKLLGIDIDESVINYAKSTYPAIQFVKADAHDLRQDFFLEHQFNIITLFSSFYCFKNQEESLGMLNKIAAPGAKLIIFDYSALENYTGENPFSDDVSKPFNPIVFNSIKDTLMNSGWNLKETINLTNEFESWYQQLFYKLIEKRSFLIELYGQEPYGIIYNRFVTLIDYITSKKIGGTLIYANK